MVIREQSAMRKDQIENIYDTLIGQMQEDYCVPGVENLFADGSECELAYDEMLGAYARLRDRLGVTDEDTDVEMIINSLLKMLNLLFDGFYIFKPVNLIIKSINISMSKIVVILIFFCCL